MSGGKTHRHMVGVVMLLRSLGWMAMMALVAVSPLQAADGVVLLHGIARSPASLEKMEAALKGAGYRTLNLSYPARTESLEGIVAGIDPAVAAFAGSIEGQVHFVTHSMGGLVARGYIHRHRPANLGRVVMLAPPNGGSDVADFLLGNPAYTYFFGPAGQQLSTHQAPALKELLGNVDYPLGVIAGDRSVNLISSWLVIPGPDDGKVSVSQTAVEGMSSSIVLHVTHPFMMSNPAVISQTLMFLRGGRFGEESRQ